MSTYALSWDGKQAQRVYRFSVMKVRLVGERNTLKACLAITYKIYYYYLQIASLQQLEGEKSLLIDYLGRIRKPVIASSLPLIENEIHSFF